METPENLKTKLSDWLNFIEPQTVQSTENLKIS